jgi:tRNA pseudouridine38-40 synthase
MDSVRIRMLIEYDGTAFSGWQIQPHTRTVQGEIESILLQLCGRRIPVMGSGRTDRGVHALGQVAHADISNSEVERVMEGLPSMLPDDVAVSSVEIADSSFHARFDAVSRLYRYRIEKKKHPISIRYCHVLPESHHLDTAAMRIAARLSLGRNSWRAMAKEGSANSDWIVDVMETSVEEDGTGWTFLILANRFLRGMVRLWTGTLVKIGTGSREPELITSLLSSGEREEAGMSLPGKGLTLMEVHYS